MTPKTSRSIQLWNFTLANILVLALIVVPYLAQNQLLQWDNVGHYFSVWFLHTHLFPDFSGWNPFFYGGFSQGTLYPPLFHYAAAALGFIVPLKLAYKLIVVLAVASTLPAYYYLARQAGLKAETAATSAVCLLALLMFPYSPIKQTLHVGANFLSTFNVGLVTNALALPFLFLYGGALLRSNFRQNAVLPSLLLAILILTHVHTALMAVLLFVCIATIKLRSLQAFKFAAKHAALTFLLCAFWFIPFLANLPESDTAKFPLFLSDFGYVLLVVVCFVAIYLRYRDSTKAAYPLTLFIVLASAILLVLNQLSISLHFYRLIIFPLLFVPLLITLALHEKLRPVLSGVSLLIAVLVLALHGQTVADLDVTGPQGFTLPEFDRQIADRTLVMAAPADQVQPHIFQHLLPLHHSFFTGKGLFAESSQNAKFFMTLEKLIEPRSFAWGIPIAPLYDVDLPTKKRLISRALKALGVNGIISTTLLHNLDFQSVEPLFTYRLLTPSYSFDVDNIRYVVRAWEQERYFASSEGKLILVDTGSDSVSFTVFDSPDCDGPFCILETNSSLYLTRDYDSHFKIIEQVLPKPSANEIVEWPASFGELDTVKRISLTEVASLPNYKKRNDYAHHPLKLTAYHYKLPHSPLVETVKQSTEQHTENWEAITKNWFVNPDSASSCVNATLSELRPSPGASIEKLSVSKLQDRLSFRVNSPSPTPVLVRISYSPNWRAYQGGEPLTIYRACPNYMMVLANDEVVLQFKKRGYEVISLALSALSWAGLLAYWVARRRREAPTEAQSH